jgi:hypothetical protein
LPAPSISADGSGALRMLPGSPAAVIEVIVITGLQLTPPVAEVRASSTVMLALSSGMTSFPLGWTSGWPPITPTAGAPACVQVRLPSRE